MNESEVKRLGRPRRGSVRELARAPLLLYRAHLGWLLGQRFLKLSHIGRRTGARHSTVLEVVRRARDGREYVVLSGFGPSSDWFRNLQANGAAEVTVGRRHFRAAHRVLDHAEAASVLADYEARNRLIRPVVRRVLSRLLGWHYDGSDASRARVVGQLPVVALRPDESAL